MKSDLNLQFFRKIKKILWVHFLYWGKKDFSFLFLYYEVECLNKEKVFNSMFEKMYIFLGMEKNGKNFNTFSSFLNGKIFLYISL
jgi:hypothetical protein